MISIIFIFSCNSIISGVINADAFTPSQCRYEEPAIFRVDKVINADIWKILYSVTSFPLSRSNR